MANTFIEAYLNHTQIYETPLSFWKWSAYSTISSILKDRCYLKQGDGFLYANLYVLFIAESSGHRKNRPVELSQSILENERITSAIAGTKTISGYTSVQAIMDELARSETDGKTGRVRKSNSATFFAPELSASLVEDPQSLRILTDIYDNKINKYKSRLRTGPSFNLENIAFSILAASNESMLKNLITPEFVMGGFLARTMLIMPNERRPPNSLLRLDYESLKISKEQVLQALLKVCQIVGEFKLEENAIDEYDSWYNPFREEYEKKKEQTGVIGRIHTTVLKVAMILAANDLTLCIQKKHIEQAINECIGLIPNYSVFTMHNAKTEIGQVGGIVITDLLSAKNHMLSRKTIIRSNWQNFDVDMLDKAVIALESAGMITQHVIKNETWFELTQQALNMLG